MVPPEGVEPSSAPYKSAALTGRRRGLVRVRTTSTTTITAVDSPAFAVVINAVRIRVANAVWAATLDEPGLTKDDGPVAHAVGRGVVEDTRLSLTLAGSVNYVLTTDGVSPLNHGPVCKRSFLLGDHEF